MGISEWVKRHAIREPNKIALRTPARILTYAQFDEEIETIACMLKWQLGIKPQDRVAFLSLNCSEFLSTLFACARIGAIFVPLNSRLTVPEHIYMLQNADIKVLLLQEKFTTLLPSVQELLPHAQIIGIDFSPSNGKHLSDLLAAGQSHIKQDSTTSDITLTDPLLIIYTSGTTGYPKGVVHTQEAIQWNAINDLHLNNLTSRDHVLTVLPLFHVGGFNVQTLPAFYCGATVTLHTHFDPEKVLKSLSEERPTMTHMVPSMMWACTQSTRWQEADFSHLRTLLTGSTMVPPNLCHKFEDKGVAVTQLYGATETCPIAIYKHAHAPQDKATSIGLPAPHCVVRVADDKGKSQAVGEVGEILVKGINVMLGYWKNEAATAQVLRDGWYHTGDMGYRDQDGYYFICDRKKNMIVKGGENIYPAEIERVLNTHPEIQESAVVGIPDEQWQEIPLAVLVPENDSSTPIKQMRTFLGDKLAEYKIPHHFIFVDELPKNAMGKLQHFQLRENILSNQTLMTKLMLSTNKIDALADNFLKTLQQAPPLERYDLLIPVLYTIIEDILVKKHVPLSPDDGNFETGCFDSQQPLLTIGLDSLLSIELSNYIRNIFDVDISISFLISTDTGNIASIADYILKKLPENMEHKYQKSGRVKSSFQVDKFIHELTIRGIELWPHGDNLKYAGTSSEITSDIINKLNLHEPSLLKYLYGSVEASASEGQRMHWLIYQDRPNNPNYTLSFPYQVDSSLDIKLLRRALQLLVGRHVSLRTRFTLKNDRLIQKIDGYQKVAFEEIDAIGWSETDLIKKFHERPFDLSIAPLFRVMLFRHTAQHYIFVLSMHHIIADGWSISLLVDELSTLYTALKRRRIAKLDFLKYDYIDYTKWQKVLLEREDDRFWSYWKKQLAGDLPVLQLPTDSVDFTRLRVSGIGQKIYLSTENINKLKQVAQEQGCTLYTLLLTTYFVFLHHYSAQDDILVRLPATGRTRLEFINTIGFIVSPILIRADFSNKLSFVQFLKQVKTRLQGALDHQDYPLIRIIDRFASQNNGDRQKLYQTNFSFQKSLSAEERDSELIMKPIPFPLSLGREVISLELTETDTGLKGFMKADAKLFTVGTLARMSEYFVCLLEQVATKSSINISSDASDKSVTLNPEA